MFALLMFCFGARALVASEVVELEDRRLDHDALQLVSVALDDDGDGQADRSRVAEALALPQLINVDLKDWDPGLLNNKQQVARQGQPRRFIESDRLLSTGLLNIHNIEMRFDASIVNRDGAELLIVEFGEGDELTVAINGVSRTTGSELAWSAPVGTTARPNANFARSEANQGKRQVNSLDDLNAASWVAWDSRVPPLSFSVLAVDLSDFGYEAGETVENLRVVLKESTDVDLVYVGAIPSDYAKRVAQIDVAMTPSPMPSKRITEDAPIDIRVDPQTRRNINGYTEVQQIFGMMWGGNMPEIARPKVEALVRELNINAARAIFNGWVSQLPDKYPPWSYSARPRFDTWQQAIAWWDQWIAQTDPDAFWMRRFNEPKRATKFTDGSMGSHYAAIVSGLKAHEGPKSINVRFFQPCNEPNSQHYLGQWRAHQDDLDVDSPMNTAAAVDAYVKTFNTAYLIMKREHPEVDVVGTCAGWMAPMYYEGDPPKGNESNWKMWVGRFIDGLEDPASIKYYNYHSYSTPMSQHLAIMGLTQNYAEIQHGRRPRSIVTETNYNTTAMDAENRRKQFLFNLNDLFMMLERPDMFDTRTQFVCYGWARRGFPRHASILINEDGTQVEPTVVYWPLWTMNNTRGTMLVIENSSQQVKAFASNPEPGKVVVSVYNPTEQERQATIDSGLSDRQVASVALRQAVYKAALVNCDTAKQTLKAASTISMTIPPLSVQNITFTARRPIRPNRTLTMTSYYGNRTQARLNTDRVIQIMTERTTAPDRAYLRVAMMNKRQDGKETLLFNEQPIKLDWAKHALDEQLEYPGWVPQRAGWIRIPIDPEMIQQWNNVMIPEMEDQTCYFVALELYHE